MLEEKALQTDLLLLNFHEGTYTAEVNETYMFIRRQFARFNYSVPIHVLCAHDHVEARKPCY